MPIPEDMSGHHKSIAHRRFGSGRLALLYVSPDVRFRGVSSALMAFLEGEARPLGIREIRLESSATARRFYAERGFSPDGEPSLAFGNVNSYLMWKRLVP
jgi:GNAT superfamily N-acetyltransferase